MVFDDYPEDISWQIEKMNDSGNNVVLKTFNATSDDNNMARNEFMCLEGNQMYRFTINDSYGDGIEAPGHYNITSEGNMIVQGGEFFKGEITSFSVPFVSGSAISSVMTQAPTISPPPFTPFPTDSMTEVCEDITTKKDCIKSTNSCIWETTVEGGPMCVLSEA